MVKETLKILKVSLRNWNKKMFGWFDLELENDIEEVSVVDDLLSNFLKYSLLLQKSRLCWTIKGDTNSSSFYNVMKGRNRRKHVGSLETGRGIIESIGKVKEDVRRYFDEKVQDPDITRPELERIEFKCHSIMEKKIGRTFF